MRVPPTLTLFMGIVIGLSGLAAAGDDWPQFRGPSGDGISTAKSAPLTWSESENVAWKTALPGRGRSSPVVLGDRIWLTTAVETNVVRKRVGPDDCQVADRVKLGAVCLERASGKILWHVTVFDVEKPVHVHWFNSWATPTPVVEPGRLYCDFGVYGTACLDAESGKTLWTQKLPIDHMAGPGSSPLLYKDLLMLVRDGCDAQYVAALDKNTGATVWKTPRPPLLNARPDMKKSFSTPLLIEAGGATQMVVAGSLWVVAYEPATGKEIWRVKHSMGFSLAPRPVAGNGFVYVCTGCLPSHLLAIRPDGQGDVTATHVAWRISDQQIPSMPSPILVGKEIYTVSNNGQVFCFNALTGEMLSSCRLATGTYLASPVLADGRLYFCSMDGKATVLKADRTMEKLAENKLGGVVGSSPAILGDGILLRTDTHLYCIANRK